MIPTIVAISPQVTDQNSTIQHDYIPSLSCSLCGDIVKLKVHQPYCEPLLLNHLKMRLRRDAVYAVDGNDVLGAGGEGYYAVHLGPEQHVVAGAGDGRLEAEAAVRPHRDVHKQVPGAGCFGRRQSQFSQGRRGITWEHTRLITGRSPAELAALGVRVGACAVPAASQRGPNVFGPEEDPLVSAWIFDNRGGSLTLVKLWQRLREAGLRPRRTVHLCFLVQEETGLLGARGWARRNEVETFIAVDSSPMPRGVSLQLDGRPASWSRDSRVHFHQGLIGELDAAAVRAGTGLQHAVYSAAASDATGVLETGGAPRCATIGYPRENSHGYEVVRWSVFDNLERTLFEYLSAL